MSILAPDPPPRKVRSPLKRTAIWFYRSLGIHTALSAIPPLEASRSPSPVSTRSTKQSDRRTLDVSGNVGANHGTGAQAWGIFPAGQLGGGSENPVRGFGSRAEALASIDPNFVGPSSYLGDISDVDLL